EFVRYYTALIEIAKESPDALDLRESDVAAAQAQVSGAVRNATGIEKMRAAEQRSRAQLRSAAAAMAVERFRRDRDRWPGTLDELVPAYLKAMPLDPYDGQPLRMRRLKR